MREGLAVAIQQVVGSIAGERHTSIGEIDSGAPPSTGESARR